MEEKITQILNERIKPMLEANGGSIEFVSFEDGVVKVKLQGACRGCPGAAMTLSTGVERILKDTIPEVKKVEAI